MININTEYIMDYISVMLNKKPEDIETKDLKAITNLSLRATDIAGEFQETDFSDLQYFTELEELDLSNMMVTRQTLEYICRLEKIKELKFYNCEFMTTIEGITGLKKIEQLTFVSTKPSDISSVAKLSSLKKLGLIHLILVDMKFISYLANLEELDLTNSNVMDANISKLLKNLKVIRICGSTLEKIRFLKDCEHLTKVYLDKRQYSDNPEVIKYLKEKNIDILDEHGFAYESD